MAIADKERTPMTPQTAAALRALVTKWRNLKTDFAAYKFCANELAAVLTQEGADNFTWHNPAPFKSAAITGGESKTMMAGCDSTSATECSCPLFNCPVHTYRMPSATVPAEPRAAEGAGTDVVRPLGKPTDYSYGLLEDGLNLAAGLNDTKPTAAAAAVPAGGDAVAPGPRIEYRDPEWISMDSFPPTGPVLIVHENDDGGRWVEAWEARCWHRDRANIRPDTPKHLIHANGIAWMWAPKLPGETMLSYPPAPRGGVTEAMVDAALRGWYADAGEGLVLGELAKAAMRRALDALSTPPAAQAQDAGPKARHWKQAIFNFFGHPFDVTSNECDRIEQDARALATKEAR
jgi:hypothetical protein